MSNKLTKALLVVAFIALPMVAHAKHHHAGHHHHSSSHFLPTDDLTCLANTIYREARNSDSNLQAVANVAKNRLVGGWRENYCRVVHDGKFV